MVCEDIKNLFQDYYSRSGITHKVKLRFSIGKSYGAGAFKESIRLNNSVVKIFNTEIALAVTKHLLGHELAHIKFDKFDKKAIIQYLTYLVPFFRLSKLIAARDILREIRADIMGNSFTGISDDEIVIAHNAIHDRGMKLSKKERYISGYPTTKQRIELEIRFKNFTDDTVNYIMETVIKDFCEVRRIKDFNRFVEDLRKLL